jgi:hypothetical protein
LEGRASGHRLDTAGDPFSGKIGFTAKVASFCRGVVSESEPVDGRFCALFDRLESLSHWWLADDIARLTALSFSCDKLYPVKTVLEAFHANDT